ncbi:DUF5988 family protein [Actinokineospora xionganensis]|uniref:Uncharacterized protein n=1 Tax=Actinokineospora xionganensis TaxID=2684470 RepID=A0ABR7L4M1_9PSEU|nr:DUF5988 family protein [Actinokineospora xionganensis]MBC6447379.1 hypothetical protein [Actinokineospora xionganensis]
MEQIRVLLVGGPADLSENDVREIPALTETVKVTRGCGYEHFRYAGRSSERHGTPLPVFEWCHRTKIAE